MRGILVGLLLALTGCGSAQWVHPTKTTQQFHEDTAFCQAQAGQAVGNRADPFGELRSQVYGACMRGRGWNLEVQK
jgi:hypothetical protein